MLSRPQHFPDHSDRKFTSSFICNSQCNNKKLNLWSWLYLWLLYFLDFIICKDKMGVPGGSVVKNLPANVGSIPVGKVSWRRKCQHTPIFLPGKSLGQRSLVGYSWWGHKELDVTEWLNMQKQSICLLNIVSIMVPITMWGCIPGGWLIFIK